MWINGQLSKTLSNPESTTAAIRRRVQQTGEITVPPFVQAHEVNGILAETSLLLWLSDLWGEGRSSVRQTHAGEGWQQSRLTQAVGTFRCQLNGCIFCFDFICTPGCNTKQSLLFMVTSSHHFYIKSMIFFFFQFMVCVQYIVYFITTSNVAHPIKFWCYNYPFYVIINFDIFLAGPSNV